MDKMALKHYCLSRMGIPIWRQVTLSHALSVVYGWGILSSDVPQGLTPEESVLLEKMQKAMESKCNQVIILKEPALFWHTVLQKKLQKLVLLGKGSPKALGLSFSQNPQVFCYEGHSITVACVPSLSSLLKEKQAKKEAWEILKRF